MRRRGDMRNAALGLLVVASTACGRIAFDPLGTSGDGPMGDSDGSAQANGCIRVDNLPPVTPYDCATVEQQILSGNIASVSDAALIDWAQHDCMRKPAPAAFAAMAPSAMFPMTTGTGPSCSSGAPPGADGTAPNYTYTGSGTLNLGSVTGTCGDTNLLGTYSEIQFATISSSSAVNTHYDGCRTIDVDRLSASATLQAYDYASAGPSPYPVQFLVGTIEATSQLIGSSDNDLVVVAGTVGGNQIASLAGDDTVVIGGGLLSDDATDTFLQLGDGNDTAYVQEIGVVGASPQSDVYAGAGADHVYFNTFRVEDIFGEGGDDVLSCTGLFGAGSCTLFGDWAFLEGEGGNDIISVDGPLIQTAATGGSTTINGGAGFNIVYVKTISNTSNNRSVSIDVTTTGGSLLVLGGDYSTSKASTITGAGADNVLLIKSGAANTGFTFTGFARTLTY